MTESLLPLTLGPLHGRVFDAVIFDMDGTLIDSTPAVERSWEVWAREFGLTKAALSEAHGIPAAATARLLVAPDRVEEAILRIDELELADVDGVVPLPGAVAALNALSDQRRAIATSCTRPLLVARLAASGIPQPAIQVSADDVVHGKPAPDPFLLAAELLGVDPAHCLVIEDAPGGLAGAQAAGCATLAVTTTVAPERLVADAVVGTLADVILRETPAGVELVLA